MKFQGTDSYVATDDLKVAVNAAVTLERPLLVKGEPGTGKTELARQVASALGLPIIECPEASERIQEGDEVSVDFDTGVVTNWMKPTAAQIEAAIKPQDD